MDVLTSWTSCQKVAMSPVVVVASVRSLTAAAARERAAS
jgi:hypothetical protein